MPKRYRIEMQIFDKKTNEQVADAEHEETYETEDEATTKFKEKDVAARNAGKGSG